MTKSITFNSPVQRRAFTLVEILVVLAIVSLLAALILPVVSRSRQQAARASCVSNLHQLGLAVQMYQQDCGGEQQLQKVPQQLDVFVDHYVKTPALLVCPLDSTPRGYGRSVYLDQPSLHRISYGYLGARYAVKDWEPDPEDPKLEEHENEIGLFSCQLHGHVVDDQFPSLEADGTIGKGRPKEFISLYGGVRLRVMPDGHINTDQCYPKVDCASVFPNLPPDAIVTRR